ncbi:hypothetical protein [uncultured Polaribacter sp.]|uniref:hypothetical protein n=1 Tax=uncultured Polaribacter sp. TaxID=174711 RepID=UPI0026263A8A|nr:hypothetical protein [uncultured Polaribacter sp.]
MKPDYLKVYISYIFITIFLSLKVAGLHVFTHDQDGVEHCEVCEFVITTNLNPFIGNGQQEYLKTNPELFIAKEIIKIYDFVYDNTLYTNALFSRPPPSLV